MAGGIGGFLGKLFGGGGGGASGEPKADPPQDYKGYTIIVAPRQEGNVWVVAGKIRKDGPDGPQEYDFIRADSYPDRQPAAEFTLMKARQIIDNEGDMIFRKS
jgi:hypothetical protein